MIFRLCGPSQILLSYRLSLYQALGEDLLNSFSLHSQLPPFLCPLSTRLSPLRRAFRPCLSSFDEQQSATLSNENPSPTSPISKPVAPSRISAIFVLEHPVISESEEGNKPGTVAKALRQSPSSIYPLRLVNISFVSSNFSNAGHIVLPLYISTTQSGTALCGLF